MTPPPLPSRRRRLRIVLSLLVLALLASLIANALLLVVARHFYSRELAQRLQQVAETPVSSFGDPAHPHVLFLGDSRIAEWPPLPADRFFTLNAGIGGETTAQIHLRTEKILLAEKPAVVVLQAGINDLKSIDLVPDSPEQIQSQCLTNLLAIVQLCRQHDARVILIFILPPGKISLGRRLVWSPEIPRAVDAVNQSLTRTLAHTNGVTLLDCTPLLAPDLSDYRDTLHLTPAAYQKLNTALLPLLDSAFSNITAIPTVR